MTEQQPKAELYKALPLGLAACLLAGTLAATVLIALISLTLWTLPDQGDVGIIKAIYRFFWGISAIICVRELWLYYRND